MTPTKWAQDLISMSLLKFINVDNSKNGNSWFEAQGIKPHMIRRVKLIWNLKQIGQINWALITYTTHSAETNFIEAAHSAMSSFNYLCQM